MREICARNVHRALPLGIKLLQDEGVRRSSRVGACYEHPEPVVTVYERPTERVLFWPERDANPFFHIFEALWMCRGRQDVEWIAVFNARMREYAEPDGRIHGAYGWRWREEFGFDQIGKVVQELRVNPESRRAVLQMWDAALDLGRNFKDLPCNTQIYFKIRDGRLLMTVLNRSNDIWWGLYGANAVHMSVLAELVADRVGVAVGNMTTISDSFHAYEGVWEKGHGLPVDQPCPYAEGEVRSYSLHADEPGWDEDLAQLFEDPQASYRTRFFRNVVAPMYEAHRAYRAGSFGIAFDALSYCRASDWRRAAMEWLQRRPSYIQRTNDCQE